MASVTTHRGTPEVWVALVVRIPVDLHAAIKAQAAAEERSMAQLVRYALRLHLESREDAS